MADYATLGHFLPYLLGRRLQAVLWPDSVPGRISSLFVLVLMMGYGAGFGVMLNHSDSEKVAEMLPPLLIGVNASLLVSALLVDFLPMLRPVTRPLPEHFPVSARQNVFTAFLLDLITLRRLIIVAALLVALAVAPRHALVPGFTLLLVLGAAALSFNVRLLFALRRGWHPLLALHASSLALMLWWLAHPTAPYHTALGVGMALLPWALWAAQLYWLAPYFSARYLPVETGATSSETLARLPLEWKVYARKTWMPLLIGLLFKVGMVGATGLFLIDENGDFESQGFFYFAFLPVIGFTYANNNLFGYLGPFVANELQRLGLTSRLLVLYARIVGPVVLIDCLLSAALLLGLYPARHWPLLGLLPLSAAAFSSLGLWGSLYQAKPVAGAVDFGALRNNASRVMSLCTIGLAALLYFIPWWWLRILLAGLVTVSAAWPVREVLRNNGELRRSLWRGIGA
ncbi:hypothetical protein Q5H92_18265 [Hymenobacter sp. M29]|uniref:Polysaccharide biosynthesis protein C-terminal domain-containing protein n=1 Tax=Hymenobacter mellowenesis TaxID=3063995 RepID=A0ABT9AEM9_9BACT|nr:hypothetical protein [Hymenobacter sp. M29]MDO7848318.1 hypothetical protein [Hymenobacter sp. M29]